eukprot:TRINITY_DN3757_c0_g1_i1.p2 TRINITY_DN3757_c0_g1~~TRINITY_DN3757_c0_g1_i1.p2  ORF type:complete len:129 (-),score=9.48 TRINITY_DN3757_c0_g1_i1:105-491(-)
MGGQIKIKQNNNYKKFMCIIALYIHSWQFKLQFLIIVQKECWCCVFFSVFIIDKGVSDYQLWGRERKIILQLLHENFWLIDKVIILFCLDFHNIVCIMIVYFLDDGLKKKKKKKSSAVDVVIFFHDIF